MRELRGLSNEIREKLQSTRPRTIGTGRQARRHHAGGPDAAGRASQAQPGADDGEGKLITARQAERPALVVVLIAIFERGDRGVPAMRIPSPHPSRILRRIVPRRAHALTPVSRETVERLDRFVAAPADLAAHDQSDRAFDGARNCGPGMSPIRCNCSILRRQAQGVDRSGYGWRISRPRACLRARRQARCAVHLVESNLKKAAFLREAQRAHRRAGARSCRCASRISRGVSQDCPQRS